MENARMRQDTPGALGDGIETGIKRIGPQNDVMVSQLHGELTEACRGGWLFHAGSQASTTTTVGLAATYTGLCLSNPAASGKLLIPRMVGIGFSEEPAATSVIGLHGGYTAAGIVTHTTPLTVYNNRIGVSAGSAVGLADAAATTVGTEEVIMAFGASFADGELQGNGPMMINLAGGIIIAPGAWVAVYTETLVKGIFSMWWEEIDE